MSTTVNISPEVQTSLTVEASETSRAMALLERFEICSEDDYKFAGELLKSAKERWKALEEKRTAVTGPLNAALREINGWFKPAQEPYKKAEDRLKHMMSAYILTQRAKAAETMQAAAQAAQAGDIEGAAAHVATLAPAPAIKGVSVREVWDFEVVDPAAVPREFLTVDVEKVKSAIWYADTEKTPPRPIPGLRFFLKGQVSVRSGR